MTNNTTIPSNLYSLAYGTTSSNPFIVEFQSRDPTTTDINFPIQKLWLNTSTNNFWFLKNFLPSNGNVSANWIALCSCSGGGGGMCNTLVAATLFTASGTWTKNAATLCVTVYLWNGGAGGGSGQRGVSGSSAGGGGGAGGGVTIWMGNASYFGASETVTIGAGGTGGAAQTVDSSPGNDGGIAGFSSLGNIESGIQSASKGQGAVGGLGRAGTGNRLIVWDNDSYTNVLGTITPSGGAGSTATGAKATDSGTATNMAVSAGGGGGSGANSTTAQQAGAGGGIQTFNQAVSFILNGGDGGIETGTVNGGNGTDGVITTGGLILGATGGGGGGGMKSVGPGTGGNGGFPGGGGGGGGGSLNGTNSGAGGNGGAGAIYILEFS